jgi:hypothetical protein
MSEERWKERAQIIELARPYGRFALLSLLFGASAVFMAHEAETNDRGLIINGIIHLDPGSADVFYAVMALLSIGFVAIGVMAIFALRARKRFRIVLGKKRMAVAARFRAWERVREEEIEVRYDDVSGVTFTPLDKPVVLTISRREGAPLVLSKQFMPVGWTLRSIGDLVMQRVRERADKVSEDRERAPRPPA